MIYTHLYMWFPTWWIRMSCNLKNAFKPMANNCHLLWWLFMCIHHQIPTACTKFPSPRPIPNTFLPSSSFLLQLIRLKSTSLMAHKCQLLLDLETAKSVQNWQWTAISTTPLETEWLWSTIQWMTQVPLVWFTVCNVGTVPTVTTS